MMITTVPDLPPQTNVAYMHSVEIDSEVESMIDSNFIYNIPISGGLQSFSQYNSKIKIDFDEMHKPYIGVIYDKESFSSFDQSTSITLLKEVVFRLESDKSFFCIRWGCKANSYNELEKTLARRFQILSEKAFRDELTESESKYWRNIVSDIDYKRYAFARETPYYIEAKVESIKKNKISARCFADNVLRHIKGDAISACRFWEKGDCIGMFVKFDMEDNIIFIESSSILDIENDTNSNLNLIKVIKI